MCGKSCSLFDVLIFCFLIALCQTLYRMQTSANKPFIPLFATVAQEDTTFVKKELSRFFLYLSQILKPVKQDVRVPAFLLQLDTLSSQLARAYHTTHQDRYTNEQRTKYQQELSLLLTEVEKTAHDYIKQASSSRLLTPQGLSSQISNGYTDTKRGLTLTQQAHTLFEAMQSNTDLVATEITSIEQGLQENEALLTELTR